MTIDTHIRLRYPHSLHEFFCVFQSVVSCIIRDRHTRLAFFMSILYECRAVYYQTRDQDRTVRLVT